jgi:hypothetical protein
MLLFGLGHGAAHDLEAARPDLLPAPSIFLRERRLVRSDMVKEGHG